MVGHTPTSGVIWPRYDAKVVMIDSGIARAYGGFLAYLEITPEGLFAGYRGGKLPLPASDDERVPYLEKVIGMDPGNQHLHKRLQTLTAPAIVVPAAAEEIDPESAAGEENTAESAAEKAPAAKPIPICGISP